MADEDFLIEIAKDLLGVGINLAIPGLGSLIAIAIKRRKNKEADLNAEIVKELASSFQIAAPPERSKTRRISMPKWSKDKASTGLEEIGLGTLMEMGGQTMDEPLQEVPLPGQQMGWREIGKTQLALASAKGSIPGTWQDEFAALIQTLAQNGLESDERRDDWCKLLQFRVDERDPSDHRLRDWAHTVTKVFATRMEMNPDLQPFLNELRRSDRIAMQHALLWRLDEQRRSLAIIAFAICALLVSLGVEIDVLQ